jgi:hypothetical protein
VLLDGGGLRAGGVAHAQPQQLVRQPGAAARSEQAAMHRQVQVPPVIVRQRALPGHDLHIKHAAWAESPDHRQANHHVRATSNHPLNGEHRAGLQRWRPRPRREFRQSPWRRLFLGRQGLENMTLRYAARQQTAQMPLRATWPARTEGGQIALIWMRAMARRQPVASMHSEPSLLCCEPSRSLAVQRQSDRLVGTTAEPPPHSASSPSLFKGCDDHGSPACHPEPICEPECR